GVEVLQVGLRARRDLTVFGHEILLGVGQQREILVAQLIVVIGRPVGRGRLRPRLAGLRVDLPLVLDRGLLTLGVLVVAVLVSHRYFRRPRRRRSRHPRRPLRNRRSCRSSGSGPPPPRCSTGRWPRRAWSGTR